MADRSMRRVNRIVGQLSPSPVAGWPHQYGNVAKAPQNAIFATKAKFKASKHPNKVNLGIGAYRDDTGNPIVMKAVRAAERELVADNSLNHEYLPITGDPDFAMAGAKLMFGANSPAILEKRIAVVQSISGTGSLRLAAAFVEKFFPGRECYISDPTWGNHNTVFGAAGIKTVKKYRYWDEKTRTLDFAGMCEDLENAPSGSVILMHACAHNPTGVDPTNEQWVQLGELIKAKGHFPFFDSAYQGFATGSLEADAFAVRHFVATGHSLLCCQSFAKNFGLYSERAGTVSFVCQSEEQAVAVKSQIALIVRPMYSNPPAHGARTVKKILSSPALYRLWEDELKEMSGRILEMRHALVGELKKLGTPGDWSHIISQIGMFSYTGLTKPQCKVMMDKWEVYLLMSGRISMAGLNTGNVAWVAKAMDDCVRNH